MAARSWLLVALGLGMALQVGCVSPNQHRLLKKEYALQSVQLDEYERENDRLRTRLEVLAGQIRTFKLEKKALQSEDAALDLRAQQLAEREQALARALEEAKQEMARKVVTTGQPEFDVNPDTGGIVLGADILFGPGRNALSAGGQQLLRKLVDELGQEKYQEYAIEVAGRTDPDPIRKSNWQDNWQLSAERARAVLRYLVQHGIAADRLHLAGYGPNQPVAAGEKSKQRRVEVLLVRR